MRISTRSRYGLRMVLDIAIYGQESPVRIVDVARRQNLSVKYLEKLIRMLKTKGFINSKRGPRGGHMLARPLGDISIGELVRTLEGDGELVECIHSAKYCRSSAECLTRRIWMGAARAMFRALDDITISDLINELRAHPAGEAFPDIFSAPAPTAKKTLADRDLVYEPA